MKSKFFSAIIAVLAVVSLSSCGSGHPSRRAPGSAREYELPCMGTVKVSYYDAASEGMRTQIVGLVQNDSGLATITPVSMPANLNGQVTVEMSIPSSVASLDRWDYFATYQPQGGREYTLFSVNPVLTVSDETAIYTTVFPNVGAASIPSSEDPAIIHILFGGPQVGTVPSTVTISLVRS